MDGESSNTFRDQKGRFLAGNSGNGGRKRGSRSKLGEEFISALYSDFEEHGEEVIAKVRQRSPETYLEGCGWYSACEAGIDLNCNA